MTETGRRWAAFALLSIAFFMVNLDFSIVSIALPAMQSGLGMTPSTAQWVLSAYAMLFAGFLMLSGSLADLFGRRRFFLAGIALFAVASLLGGLANDATTLVAMRALQGLGAAMCNPAGLAIATTLFPAGQQRNRAIGLWVVVGSAGIIFGMILGGILVSTLGWRAVLWVNVPICAALLALVPIVVARDAVRARRLELDVPGALLLTATLLLLTFTVVRVPDDGFASLATIGRAIGVVVLAIALLIVERRTIAPLIPRRVFEYRDFAGGSLLALLQAAGYSGMVLYASVYWQHVARLPPLLTGFAFLPSALVMTAAVGPISAPLAQRFGARVVGGFGSIVMIAGMAVALYVTMLPPTWWLMLIVTVIACAGCMATFEMSMIAGLAHVDEKDEGTASGAISTASQIGMGLGVAVAAAFATGRLPAAGTHLAFWSPLAFSFLTLAVCAFFIAGRTPRVARPRVLRAGKLAFLARRSSPEFRAE